MKKSIIAAGAASVALAAMPIVGVFADPVTEDSVMDTINVTVNPSCEFTAGKTDPAATYSGSGSNGASATFATAAHNFTVFCNNNAGYRVTASTDALQSGGITDIFAYKTSLPTSRTDTDANDGAWNVTISQTGTALNITQLNNPTSGSTATSGTIATHTGASTADGESFTATYAAWIGNETPTGTYTGTITYTLVTGN